MKSYLVEVERTKTIRQRTRVVVTVQSNRMDKGVMYMVENEADRAIKKGGDYVAWTDVPETEHWSGNPSYTISPVLVVQEGGNDGNE